MQAADAPLSVAGKSRPACGHRRRQPGPPTPATGQKETRDVEADGRRGQPVRPEGGWRPGLGRVNWHRPRPQDMASLAVEHRLYGVQASVVVAPGL